MYRKALIALHERSEENDNHKRNAVLMILGTTLVCGINRISCDEYIGRTQVNYDCVAKKQ